VLKRAIPPSPLKKGGFAKLSNKSPLEVIYKVNIKSREKRGETGYFGRVRD
jgi:hypothetical protein